MIYVPMPAVHRFHPVMRWCDARHAQAGLPGALGRADTVEQGKATVGRAATLRSLARSRTWLRLAQMVWAVVVALDMVTFIVTIPSGYRAVQQPCAGSFLCGGAQLSKADWSAMQARGITPRDYATFALAAALALSLLLFAAGYFIAWCKWDDTMALFVSAVFITYAATNFS